MNETLTPCATFGSFKDGRRQEEKKAIEAYVRQNMADFDITKRHPQRGGKSPPSNLYHLDMGALFHDFDRPYLA
ncbi:hypothetical protein NHP21011_02620 [Helicobacter heilmannii]|nr:hypothetical protein NHP21011_02620 [Helicobacter heilmannii]